MNEWLCGRPGRLPAQPGRAIPGANSRLQSGSALAARQHPKRHAALASGTLRVLQLHLSLEPVLLITARFLSLRKPNRIGLFCDYRMRGACSLWLCRMDQRNAGTRNWR